MKPLLLCLAKDKQVHPLVGSHTNYVPSVSLSKHLKYSVGLKKEIVPFYGLIQS
jgi:hypothetical protein